MASAPIVRPAGKTIALSVVATSHAAVNVLIDGWDTANFVALLNPGATGVAVKLSVAGTAAVLPVDGTPGDYFLAPLMEEPVFLPLPMGFKAPCQITAIATAAGPTLICATPVVIQT